MKRIAIIGAGISGLTVANCLKGKADAVVFEKEATPGGLVRCRRIDGSLFHICGGHVFNTRNQSVLDWFWSKFDREKEFVLAERNSTVFMENGLSVPYPIENHIYLFDRDIQSSFIRDLLSISSEKDCAPSNFGEFLRHRFGDTLYNLYFKPYNEKVWRRNLREVPLEWLEGKLPMPTVEEMIYNNINHVEEKKFVHSTFYYEKNWGSQFIADRLAEDVDVRYGNDINCIERTSSGWMINEEEFDGVVFCGNIKDLPSAVRGVELGAYVDEIENLEYHGTTAVFCEIDANPYSWIYQPSSCHSSHRIICTGNFSSSNNAPGKMTGTVEFTDGMSMESIIDNLSRIPLHPRYLAHNYSKYTYPIQHKCTRDMISSLRTELESMDMYLCGRFAEWEYYNMDAAMASAMKIADRIR